MKIAFIADGRAEHARRWIRLIAARGHETILLSTFPCSSELGTTRVEILPGWFRPGSAFVKTSEGASPSRSSRTFRKLISWGADNLIRPLWVQANAVDVWQQGNAAREHLRAFRPDLVHAFRFQNEGYVAARANVHPWIVSVWGQDLAYYAARYPLHRWLVRRTLQRLDGLTSDCYRDLRIAQSWGMPEGHPQAYFPGNGGVDLEVYRMGREPEQREPIVLYPRGLAPYLRPKTLLRAIAQTTAEWRKRGWTFHCLCPPAQTAWFERAIQRYGIPGDQVAIGSFSQQVSWASRLQSMGILVSPAVCDGTPNSMLEAMACGAFPVMGNIESIREWIRHGENGLLFDPENPTELADCLIRAIDDVELRSRAQRINRAVVEERANVLEVVPRIEEFYGRLTTPRADHLGDRR